MAKDVSFMDDRELLVRLDEKTDNIIKNQDGMWVELRAHIAADVEKLTREEAYKAFAPYSTTHELTKVRTTLTTIFWAILGFCTSLLVSLIVYISTGKNG